MSSSRSSKLICGPLKWSCSVSSDPSGTQLRICCTLSPDICDPRQSLQMDLTSPGSVTRLHSADVSEGLDSIRGQQRRLCVPQLSEQHMTRGPRAEEELSLTRSRTQKTLKHVSDAQKQTY